MPQRRRKGQCQDKAIGRLIALSGDPKVSGDIRLKAIILMLQIDGIYPEAAIQASAPIPEVPPIDADALLESVRAKYAKHEEEHETA